MVKSRNVYRNLTSRPRTILQTGVNENQDIFKALPEPVQAAVLQDWVWRLDNGYLRGDGLYSHAAYLDMIAQEEGITVAEVLNLPGVPV